MCAGKMKDNTVVLQQCDRAPVVPRSRGSGASTPAAITTAESSTRRKGTTARNQSKMLLRELCVDKDYLEHLTIDPSNNTSPTIISSSSNDLITLFFCRCPPIFTALDIFHLFCQFQHLQIFLYSVNPMTSVGSCFHYIAALALLDTCLLRILAQ